MWYVGASTRPCLRQPVSAQRCDREQRRDLTGAEQPSASSRGVHTRIRLRQGDRCTVRVYRGGRARHYAETPAARSQLPPLQPLVAQ